MLQFWIQHTINWLTAIAVIALLGAIIPIIILCVKYSEARKAGMNLPECVDGGLPNAVIMQSLIPGAERPRRAFVLLFRTFLVCAVLLVLLTWARGSL